MVEYEYKKVPSGYEIGRKILDFLEDCDPQNYNGMNRGENIRAINDILHDRKPQPGNLKNLYDILDELLKWQNDENWGKVSEMCTNMDDFIKQRLTMPFAYVKSTSMSGHNYTLCNYFHNEYGKPLKIISQQIYDNAVKSGFPQDFFKNSYFEGITFYCLPNSVDFSHSRLANCKFTVCHSNNDANFIKATLTDVDFETVNLQSAVFSQANLYHTRFFDCNISYSLFNTTTFKHSSMVDCKIHDPDFNGASFYNCTFGRLETSNIKGFYTVKITMDGATGQECQNNRESIYKAFGVPLPLKEIYGAKVLSAAERLNGVLALLYYPQANLYLVDYSSQAVGLGIYSGINEKQAQNAMQKFLKMPDGELEKYIKGEKMFPKDKPTPVKAARSKKRKKTDPAR